jgi:hypothetical protein
MLIGEDLEDHSTFGGVLSQAIDYLKGDVKKGHQQRFRPFAVLMY